MKRREVLTLVGGAAVVGPRVVLGQSVPSIGFLGTASEDLYQGRLRAFRQALIEVGFIESTTIAIEYRWADGQMDRLPRLAAELVNRQVSVIVAAGDPAARAAQATTKSIPVVFAGGNDPVQIGLVKSLSRPGGNITGITSLNVEIMPKRLQLLKELVPNASRVAVLLHPEGNPNYNNLEKELLEASRALGLVVDILRANTLGDLDKAFTHAVETKAAALAIGPSALFNLESKTLGALAARHQLASVFQTREFASAGGLISYGSDINHMYRLVGIYVSRLLKGEKPADLSVQQSAKIELIINLKIAQTLGLTIPTALLVRADEVIE